MAAIGNPPVKKFPNPDERLIRQGGNFGLTFAYRTYCDLRTADLRLTSSYAAYAQTMRYLPEGIAPRTALLVRKSSEVCVSIVKLG